MPRSERVAGNRHAVKNQIGEFRQQYAVLERAGLPLVGVADDVVILADRLASKTPFHSCREAGAAAAAKLRLAHLLNDLVRRKCQRSPDCVGAAG